MSLAVTGSSSGSLPRARNQGTSSFRRALVSGDSALTRMPMRFMGGILARIVHEYLLCRPSYDIHEQPGLAAPIDCQRRRSRGSTYSDFCGVCTRVEIGRAHV